MESAKKTMVSMEEGLDANLAKLHEEYLENAPMINLMKVGVINHMDTWHADLERILLQN